MTDEFRWRFIRRLLDGTVVLLVVGVGAMAALSIVGPMVGHQLFIIRSGSMEPAIPVGALVIATEDGMDDLEPGDVVTLRTPNGTVVTHRVIRLATVDGSLHLETKGDASETADPVLVPTSWLVGRVEFSLPFAGYALAYLATPLGILTVLLLGGTLLTAIWALEDLEAAHGRGQVAAAA